MKANAMSKAAELDAPWAPGPLNLARCGRLLAIAAGAVRTDGPPRVATAPYGYRIYSYGPSPIV